MDDIEELRRLPWCLNTETGGDAIAISPTRWSALLDEIERLRAAVTGRDSDCCNLEAHIEKLEGALRDAIGVMENPLSYGAMRINNIITKAREVVGK